MNAASEQTLFKLFLEKTYNGLIFKVENNTFRIIAIGDAFLKQCGLEREVLLGKTLTDLPLGILHPATIAMVEGLLSQPEELTLDLSLSLKPLLADDGSLAYVLYSVTENDRNYTFQMLNQAPVGMALLRGEHLVVEYANAIMLQLLGKSEDILKQPLTAALQGMQEQPFLKLLRDVYTWGEPLVGNESKVMVLRNGTLEPAYFNFQYQPVKNKRGGTSGVMVVATEVTQLVNVKKKLEESMTSFRHVVMNAHYALLVLKGNDWMVEIANQPLLDLWSKQKENFIGKPLLKTLPELLGQPFTTHLRRVFETGESYVTKEDTFYFNSDRGIRKKYVSYFYDPMLDAEGNVFGVIVGAEDITQRVENRLKTERAEEMLRIAVESANLGIWHYDPQSKRITVSTRLKELFGYGADEDISYHSVMAQIADEHRFSLLKSVSTAIAKGAQFNLEFSIVSLHDQRLRWLRATGKVYRDKEGMLSRLSGILMEITEDKQDEIRKNDFIAMVSHELKTPLTSLKAYVQLLNFKAKQSGDLYTSKSLAKVEGQVNKMSNMIRSFLDLSRLESGKIYLERENFTIDKLVSEIVEEVSLTDKTHTILFSTCKPLAINADREKIGQVINNLLSNAIKYSATHSKITIRCEVDNHAAIISVADEGVGLAKADIAKLFSRFYRVQNIQVKTVSGFGIGLYLSAEIIKRHKGQIWVESEEDRGSTFYFSLPLSE